MDFKTTICKSGRLTVIEIPFNAKNTFNKAKGTIFVYGTINDIPYRGKLLSKGNNEQIMVIDKKLQNQLGYNGNNMPVNVTMECEKTQELIQPSSIENSDSETIQNILSRVSIRDFSDKPIENEKLRTILHAGLCAPTAKNKRPFHFVVVKDSEILLELSKTNPNAGMLSKSQDCIIVCGDNNIEGNKEFLIADCSAATENMLLAIHSLGLGGVWCGVIWKKDWSDLIKKLLNLPFKVEPISVIALGYPNEKKELLNRYDNSKIHFDKW